MKIILAEHYGVCFGVRDAIVRAEKAAKTGPLTILGELVHNPIVRERLARAGVGEGDLGDFSGAVGTVMITAHGASDAAQEIWRQTGRTVIDGACPLVRHAHTQLRQLVDAGFSPVIIGKRGHVEVNGLAGDFPDVFIVECAADLPDLPPRSRYGVISQTTQPIEYVRELVATLKLVRPESEVHFVDTVCQPTKNRQSALQKLLTEAETIVVVGGRNSNNTRQLAAAVAAAGRRALHIERAEELQDDWFCGVEVVGVTAGTSTLKETVASVYERLQQIGAAREGAHPLLNGEVARGQETPVFAHQ